MSSGDKFKFYLADGFKDLGSMSPAPTCSMTPINYTCTIYDDYVEISGFTGEIEIITLTLDGITNPASLGTDNGNFRIEVVNSIG